MKALPRFLAASATLLAVSMLVSSCDASPYAATINSHVIKQTALNAELRAWAGNRQYVSAFDSGSGGATVVGDAPDTYSNQWVSSKLSDMIAASVVHQHLQAQGRRVNQAGVHAARAVSEISQIGWTSFPPSFRDTLVNRLAEVALLTPKLANLQTLEAIYAQYKPYFFSTVCVVQAAVFDLQAATQLSSSETISGSPVCYSQSELEMQAPGLRSAIMALGVGKVSKPVRTPYGYIVVEVSRRSVIGLTPELERTISVALMEAEGVANQSVGALMSRARVKVNPAYGSWSGSQVTPPRAPGSSA